MVFHGIDHIRLDNVFEPMIQAPTDAIVRITASAICGLDLYMVHGREDPALQLWRGGPKRIQRPFSPLRPPCSAMRRKRHWLNSSANCR